MCTPDLGYDITLIIRLLQCSRSIQLIQSIKNSIHMQYF